MEAGTPLTVESRASGAMLEKAGLFSVVESRKPSGVNVVKRSPGKRCLLAISLASLTARSTGCYGPNKLGTDRYKWNMGLSEDKWPRELVFGGLYLTGIYPICGIIDLFILNSIEFWSSDNPPTAGEAAYAGSERKTIADGSHRIELERRRVDDAWRVRVQVFEEDRLIADSVLLSKDDGTCIQLDPSGRETGRYTELPDGSVAFHRPGDGVERVYSPGEIASLIR
jgi:hypothetical protein